MRKLIILLIILLSITIAFAEDIFKEIPLNGKLVTSNDPITIGNNFQQLTNMRYRDTNPVSVSGMTKINTTAVTDAPLMTNGFHFRKVQPAESHVLAQGKDSDSAPTLVKIFQNTTAIPSAGDFTGGATPTSLYTENTAAGMARFASAPNGHMVMCDGIDCVIWGGNEARIGAFLTSEATIANTLTNPKDYSENLRNTLTAYDQRAVIGGGNNSDTILLLHMDEVDTGTSFNDSSASTHGTTANGNVQTDEDYRKFGISAGKFDGADDYITIADHADFDFSVVANTFSIDVWIRCDNISKIQSIYYQDLITDATDYFQLRVNADNTISGVVFENGAGQTITTTGTITADTWHHVMFAGDGSKYYIALDGDVEGTGTTITQSVLALDEVITIGRNQDGTQDFDGWMDEFRVVNGVAKWTSDFTAPVRAYSTESLDFLVGSTRPLQGVKFYVSVANTVASTLTMKEWQGGGWISVTITDNTDTGASLAQTGTVTWTSTESTSKPRYYEGYFLYWYNFTLSAGDAEIYYATVDAPIQTVKDLWDGEARPIESYKLYKGSYNDFTTHVYADDYYSTVESTYTSLDVLLGGSEWFVFGFSERMTGVFIKMVASEINDSATVMSVDYWDGSNWVSVGTINDGTSDGTDSLKTSGVVTWNPVPEHLDIPQAISDENILYYYRFKFTNNLDASVQFSYAYGIPAPQTIHSYKFPVFAKNRIMLASRQDKDKNSVLVGNWYTTDVFNGDDTTELFFGDESELIAGTSLYSRLGSNIYDITLFCKNNSMYGLSGFSPEDFQTYTVSETIGCAAPLTLKSAIVHLPEGGSRPVAMWQAADGIYMFDNTSPIYISRDIENFFDDNESASRRLHASYIDDSVGCIDKDKNEYVWLFADGNSSGKLNREFHFDFKRFKWFEVDRDSDSDNVEDLQGCFEVQDTTGNYYTYGITDAGHIQRLDNGTDFDGDNIVSTLWTGAFAPYNGSIMYTTQQSRHKIIAKSKSTTANTIAMTHYCDRKSTGTTLTAADPNSTATSGYSIMDVLQDGKISADYCIFHSYKYVMTADETYGFEPIFIGTKFDVINEDKTVTR